MQPFLSNISLKNSVLTNIAMPICLGLGLLYFYQPVKLKAEEIGIGKENVVYTPNLQNYPLHITYFGFTDSLLTGWKKRGEKNLTLWLGNSQLHSINQYLRGQQNCIRFLYDSLEKNNKTVLGISYPNANLQEFLLTLIYINNKCVKLKQIVLPVFFDDMREDKIRDDIGNANAVNFIKQSKDSSYFANILSITHLFNKQSKNKTIGNEMKALDETAQEKTEKYLDSFVRSNWKVWRNRPNTRAALFNDMYELRNYLMGIKGNTKRKMIPGVYKENYEALLDIFKYCQAKNIELIVYIPPIRNDVEPPYDMKAYAGFKKEVEKDVLASHAIFMNLENLVAAKYWGTKGSTSGTGSEIDFMHFQEPGHRLIADTIFQRCKK